ncbi:MAG: uroporphyrinogen-III synthase [Pelagimonas sp.]|uniref:uroporphyrinogen-III synthase n=1 Tax=Pelagimonas sp. TaxID=2073170 RepID=UPI003D6C1D59
MRDAKPILLMTRPTARSEAFLAQLPDRSAFTAIMSPAMGIEFMGDLPDMTRFKGVIFTSVNGVTAYARQNGPCLQAFAVGGATALAAQDAGLAVQSADGNADDLVNLLTEQQNPGPFLHVRGTHSTGDVAKRLTDAGIVTIEAILYDQPKLPLSSQACDALIGEIPVIAPVFSPRTAALLAKNRIKAPLLVAAMSEAVVKPLLGLHITELKIAARPESIHMANLVTDLLESVRARDYGSGQ